MSGCVCVAFIRLPAASGGSKFMATVTTWGQLLCALGAWLQGPGWVLGPTVQHHPHISAALIGARSPCRGNNPPPTASISGAVSHCFKNMHYAQPIKVGAALSARSAPLQLGKHRIDEQHLALLPGRLLGGWRHAERSGSAPHSRSAGRSFPYLAGMFSP